MIIRREAIEHILKYINDESIIVSTTGMISREIFSTKDRPSNFYMIGSMGLLSSLGLGLALLNNDKHIYIIEGDGSSLMSLGTLPLITYESPINLTHIILDNEAYESTGSQKSISNKISIANIAKACGYANVTQINDKFTLDKYLKNLNEFNGPNFLNIKTSIEKNKNIPRINLSPTDITDRFKKYINE